MSAGRPATATAVCAPTPEPTASRAGRPTSSTSRRSRGERRRRSAGRRRRRGAAADPGPNRGVERRRAARRRASSRSPAASATNRVAGPGTSASASSRSSARRPAGRRTARPGRGPASVGPPPPRRARRLPLRSPVTPSGMAAQPSAASARGEARVVGDDQHLLRPTARPGRRSRCPARTPSASARRVGQVAEPATCRAPGGFTGTRTTYGTGPDERGIASILPGARHLAASGSPTE